MPMTGRVVVRLDPTHPSWRGTLRSFRPERLVICSAADNVPALSTAAREANAAGAPETTSDRQQIRDRDES